MIYNYLIKTFTKQCYAEALMGSTGSGSFSDYTGRGGNPSSGGGSSGGSSGQDQCERAFSASLEDVAQYQLFVESEQVPPVGATLTLVLSGRVIASDELGRTIGRFAYWLQLYCCLYRERLFVFRHRAILNYKSNPAR